MCYCSCNVYFCVWERLAGEQKACVRERVSSDLEDIEGIQTCLNTKYSKYFLRLFGCEIALNYVRIRNRDAIYFYYNSDNNRNNTYNKKKHLTYRKLYGII